MSALSVPYSQSPRSTLLLALWVIVFAGILYTLRIQDQLFVLPGQSVATLKSAQRQISFQTEGDLDWHTASVKHKFFDGDRIATGPNSTAVVDFGQGRSIELGENTLLSISSVLDASGSSFIVNLSKGAIKPTVPVDAKNSITIIDGLTAFFVSPGESRGFAKPEGGRALEFSAKERFPVLAKKDPVKDERLKLPSNFVAPSVTDRAEVIVAKIQATSELASKPEVIPPPVAVPIVETPIVKAKPKLVAAPKPIVTKPEPSPVAAAEIAPAQLTSADFSQVYVTTTSLSSLQNQKISFTVSKPAATPVNWQGGIQITAGNTSEFFPADKNGLVLVTLSSPLVKEAGRGQRGALECLSLNAKGYGSISGSDAAAKSLSKTTQTKYFCSLSDVKTSGPIVVGLSQFSKSTKTTKFFETSIAKSVKNLPNQILLQRASDLQKLVPHFVNASEIAINSATSLSQKGTYVVESGEILAELNGSDITPQLADQILGSLGYSFVFRGSKDALFNASSLSETAFNDWLIKNTEQGRKVYVRSRSSLVPVSRDFMKERKEVADFVRASSNTMFMDKIEIIAFK